MKINHVPTLAILVVLMATTATAEIWVVDNNSGAVGADFTGWPLAHITASAGDTIYIVGSGISYGNVTITKKLYIIGPGYFLSGNPETQISTAMAKFGETRFESGAEGTILTGCTISENNCYVYVDNITIRGNYFVCAYYYGECLYVGNGTDPIENIKIRQNYFSKSSYSSGRYYNINVNANATNVAINNNIIYSNISGSYLTIYNNVFSEGGISVNNSVINNNIMHSGGFSGANNMYNNNLANEDQFGTLNGNHAYVNMISEFGEDAVFVGSGSSDGRWKLYPNSPAKGAGLNGEDCGMFGGNTPYVLSGLIDIPTIFFMLSTGPGTTEGGLNVQIKAKTHR